MRGTLIMGLATLCLSNSTIISKFVYRENVEPVTMLALRFGLAALLMWLFYAGVGGWRKYIRLQSRRQFWGCVVVGAANTVSQFLFYVALLDLDPGLAQMIFSLNPAIVALIMLFLGERLTRLKLVRLGLALVGLYFLTLGGGSSARPLNPFSVLIVLACAVVYAVHLVLYQKLLPNTNSRTNTLYILSTMAVIYTTFELAQHGGAAIEAVSGVAWLEILVMAVVASAIGRLLLFTGVALIGGTQVALIGIAEPVLVLVSSVIVLGEQLSLSQWLGAALIISSIALVAFVKPTPPSVAVNN